MKRTQEPAGETTTTTATTKTEATTTTAGSDAMNKMVHIAVCGLGRIGHVHLATLLAHPRVQVTALVEIATETATAKAHSIPNCKLFKDIADLLEDVAKGHTVVDGLLVCTPTSTHVRYVREALSANIPVMCEKPISHLVTEVDELYELAKQKNLFLLCGFHRRYDPNFGKLKSILDTGKVGKLLKVRSTSRDNPLHVSIDYLKVSGGIIADTASHDIDMLRYVTGEDPETVYAVAHAFSPEVAAIGDHDQLEMLFTFASGVIGTIDISRNAAYGYDQRLEILAHQGSVVVDNQKPTTVTVGSIEGFLSDPPCFSFPSRYTEAYKREIYHFVGLLTGDEKTPKLSHKDVRNMTIILNSAQQSLKEKKIVKIAYE